MFDGYLGYPRLGCDVDAKALTSTMAGALLGHLGRSYYFLNLVKLTFPPLMMASKVFQGPRQALFNLHCPSGPIELRENIGFAWPEVNRLARLLQTHWQPLCGAWRGIHGSY
jgi:hypothetical protein